MFGNSLVSIIKNYFGGFENFSTFSAIITEFIFIFATFVVFLLLYKLSNKKELGEKIERRKTNEK